MLFFTFVTIMVIGFIAAWLLGEYDHECLSIISGTLAVIATLIVVFSGIGIVLNHADADAQVARNKQIYESLVYQYENDVFSDDDDVVGKKELYNQIQDWNKDLAYYQSVQDDFWTGIFYPNVFDQFEYIEYKQG